MAQRTTRRPGATLAAPSRCAAGWVVAWVGVCPEVGARDPHLVTGSSHVLGTAHAGKEDHQPSSALQSHAPRLTCYPCLPSPAHLPCLPRPSTEAGPSRQVQRRGQGRTQHLAVECHAWRPGSALCLLLRPPGLLSRVPVRSPRLLLLRGLPSPPGRRAAPPCRSRE